MTTDSERSEETQIHSTKRRVLPSGKVAFDAERTARGHADGFTLDRRAALSALRRARLRGASPAALAATLQGALEEAALELVRAALARSGLRRLAVAGGLFANVALNGRLATLALSELAVAPAMTDQGLCAGARTS